MAYGAKKGAGYVFKDMARNAVYLPVFYSKGNYTPAYYPVKVDEKRKSFISESGCKA